MGSTEPSPRSLLSIRGFRALTHIGCGEQERSQLQWVRFDVRIRFPGIPIATTSDRLDQTSCYGEICSSIQRLCEQNQCKLIETLGWNVYSDIRKSIPKDSLLWVQITKEKPPIDHLSEGSSYCVGDFNGETGEPWKKEQ